MHCVAARVGGPIAAGRLFGTQTHALYTIVAHLRMHNPHNAALLFVFWSAWVCFCVYRPQLPLGEPHVGSKDGVCGAQPMAQPVKHELLYNAYGCAFLALLCILGYQFGTLCTFIASGPNGFGPSFGTVLAHLALAWNCVMKLEGPINMDKSYAHMLATVLFGLGAAVYVALYVVSASILCLPMSLFTALLIAFWAWDFQIVVNYRDYPLLFPFYNPSEAKRRPARLTSARPNLALLGQFTRVRAGILGAARAVAPRFVVAPPEPSDGKEPMPIDDSDVMEAIKQSQDAGII